MDCNKKDRLFLPLNAMAYEWFESGRKQWELRRLGSTAQFTPKHVYKKRSVEIRKGYNSKESLWGTIEDVYIGNSLQDVFRHVPYNLIIPSANSLNDAIKTSKEILNLKTNENRFITFKIKIQQGEK